MIKSFIEIAPDQKPYQPFPILLHNQDTQTVILVTEDQFGVVLHAPDQTDIGETFPLSDTQETWQTFKGTLTLFNQGS